MVKICRMPSGVVHGCHDSPSTIQSPASLCRTRRFWPVLRSKSSIVSLYTWQKDTSMAYVKRASEFTRANKSATSWGSSPLSSMDPPASGVWSRLWVLPEPVCPYLSGGSCKEQ